jgi:hypothetical protein
MYTIVTFENKGAMLQSMKEFGGSMWLTTFSNMLLQSGVPDKFAYVAAQSVTDEYEDQEYGDNIPRGTICCDSDGGHISYCAYESRSGNNYAWVFPKVGAHDYHSPCHMVLSSDCSFIAEIHRLNGVANIQRGQEWPDIDEMSGVSIAEIAPKSLAIHSPSGLVDMG